MSITWDELPLASKQVMLVLYAAEKVNHKGCGGLMKDEMLRIQTSIGMLTSEELDRLRAALKNNIPACKKLIYEERLPWL